MCTSESSCPRESTIVTLPDSIPSTLLAIRWEIPCTVSRRSAEVDVEVRTSLADTLRHELGLTGTHVGCEQGACGACTVLVDGDPMRSCLLLTPQVEGHAVETVEGLARARRARFGGDHRPGRPPPGAAGHAERPRAAVRVLHPGIVVSLVAAHRRGAPVDEVLDDVLDGHLCRCTGYVNIRAAVRTAWQALDVEGAAAR